VIAYQLGDIDSSYEYYLKARRIDPSLYSKDIENRYAAVHAKPKIKAAAPVDSVEYAYNQAVDLQNEGNGDSAEALYKKVLEKDPGYSQAWNNLGAIYSGRDSLRQALQCFLKVVEKRDDLPEAYINVINVYIAMDSLDQAGRWVVKGLGHNPENDLLRELDVKVKEAMREKEAK
jgi:tetratricopeptide (TPR) repeat protein